MTKQVMIFTHKAVLYYERQKSNFSTSLKAQEDAR